MAESLKQNRFEKGRYSLSSEIDSVVASHDLIMEFGATGTGRNTRNQAYFQGRAKERRTLHADWKRQQSTRNRSSSHGFRQCTTARHSTPRPANTKSHKPRDGKLPKILLETAKGANECCFDFVVVRPARCCSRRPVASGSLQGSPATGPSRPRRCRCRSSPSASPCEGASRPSRGWRRL